MGKKTTPEQKAKHRRGLYQARRARLTPEQIEKIRASDREKARLKREADPEAHKRKCREAYWRQPDVYRAYARKAFAKQDQEKAKAGRKDYYWRNRETLLAKNKAWREAQKVKGLKISHSGTFVPYQERVKAQGGKCRICGEVPKPARDGRASLYADHNHTTGENRDLLCVRCNAMLGGLESPYFLHGLLYLALHNGHDVEAPEIHAVLEALDALRRKAQGG